MAQRTNPSRTPNRTPTQGILAIILAVFLLVASLVVIYLAATGFFTPRADATATPTAVSSPTGAVESSPTPPQAAETPAPTEPAPESGPFVIIDSPADGAQIDITQRLVVSGRGGRLFEGGLVVELRDSTGYSLTVIPVIIDSPEAGTGGQGPWEVVIAVSTPLENAQIVAYSTSARDGSIVAEDRITVDFVAAADSTPDTLLEQHLWLLTELNSAPVLENIQVYAEFDEGRVSGSGGCNSFRGAYEAGESAISFTPLGMTKMMCEDAGVMTQESSFAAALVGVTSYTIGAGNLTLLNGGGEEVAVFSAAVIGTITAAEGDFPAGGATTVRLEDVSQADAPALVLDEQLIQGATTFPVVFKMMYDTAQIDMTHTYNIFVQVASPDGDLLLVSTTAHQVLTSGRPRRIEVVVSPTQ